jgi:ADP-dependent NAD(P)H-hydrate dehydratase / NAD(P)H-hydrate epimerase
MKIQTKDQPLYPDILWSRPENRLGAGKITIIGGSNIGIASVARTYGYAVDAGAGSIRVILPSSYQKTSGIGLPLPPDSFFAPSSSTGGFQMRALDEWCMHADWSDIVLISGDLGKNSETTLLLDKFLSTYGHKTIISRDAASIYEPGTSVLLRNINLADLQKLSSKVAPAHLPLASDSLEAFGKKLNAISAATGSYIATYFNNFVWSIDESEAVATRHTEELWQDQTAAKCAVLLAQNPVKKYSAITTALVL